MKAALADVDGGAIRRALDERGAYALALPSGETVELTAADVEVRATSHDESRSPATAASRWRSTPPSTTTSASRVSPGRSPAALNDLRKDLGLEIADRVLVELRADGDLLEAVERHREWIAKEILAKDLTPGPIGPADGGTELDIDGHPAQVRLERA